MAFLRLSFSLMRVVGRGAHSSSWIFFRSGRLQQTERKVKSGVLAGAKPIWEMGCGYPRSL